MAISAPVRSAQYNDAFINRAKVLAYDWGAKLRTSYGKLTFTAAGFTSAAAGDLALIRMPSGKVRIYSDLSRVVCPIGMATSDLDIGISAYTNEVGATVSFAGAVLADSLDVGGAAIDAAFTLPLGGFLEVASRDGFDIVASFDTANSPAAGDLVVAVVYSIGN